MTAMLEHTVEPCTEIEEACKSLADLAWRENRPARMEFNGIEVTAQPGDTANDLADRWWTSRGVRDKEASHRIIVEKSKGGAWAIRLGEHYHDELCWDEMLGCLVRLTINGDPTPEKAGYGGLKTKEQWDEWRAELSRRARESVEATNGNG